MVNRVFVTHSLTFFIESRKKEILCKGCSFLIEKKFKEGEMGNPKRRECSVYFRIKKRITNNQKRIT